MERGLDNRAQSDARRLAGLLSEEKRLKVVSALALGARSLDEICKTTGLEGRLARKSLGQLTEGGLVEGDPNSGYRLRTEMFRDAARGSSGRRGDVLAGVARDGRLPRGRQERLAVLERLAELFEAEHRYLEAEVNARLSRVNPDYAFLRRSLIDEGLMQLANESVESGRTVVVYWRTRKNES